MSIPRELRYTKNHEWLRIDGELADVGVTRHAADALGDIVFVQLPGAGMAVSAGEACGELESTKSVNDLYAPVDGEVIEVNEAVTSEPGHINSDPYGSGWLFRVRVTGMPELLDADDYADLIEPEQRGLSA